MNALHKLDDSSYKFFIVDFCDGYELVPRNWIIRERNECYWPDAITTKHYDRAVETMEEPKETWKICSIKKIRARAKSFQRGKEKLREVAYRSDLSTDTDALKEKKSRHSRAIKRPHWSSSSSLESDEDNNNIPPLPKRPIRFEQIEPKKVSQNKYTSPRPSQIKSTSCLTPSVSTKSDGELEKDLRTPPNPKQNDTRSFDWSTSVASPKEQSDGIKSILRAIGGIKFTLATIVANQEEIKSRIERLEENINSKENGMILDEGIDEDVLSLLPIKCDEDFTILEENLNGVHFKKKLVIELKKIGGNELKNVVYNLLPRLLTHGMAEKYSWYGAKGKRALACSNISGLIKDIVRCHFKDATDSVIEVPVKKWLSKAKERLQRDTAKKQLAEVTDTVDDQDIDTL